jgi:hypothetical protein
MKSRDVIGKKIVGVRQHRFRDRSYGWITEVLAIELDNGTELRPIATEVYDASDFPVEILVVKKNKNSS